MGLLSGIHILSLVGRQGAGKSSIGHGLAVQVEVPHIEASSVVRKVYGDIPRDKMPETNKRTATEPDWLGNAIASEILDHHDASYVIVTGAREREVHDTLLQLGASLQVIEIYADQQQRYDRHLGVKCSNEAEFLLHEDNEASIGLDELLAKCPFQLDTTHSPTIEHSVNLLRSTFLGF